MATDLDSVRSLPVMVDPRRLAQLAGLVCSLFCSSAAAQDLWEISEGAPTWEPLWDEGALLAPDAWALSLVGGHGRRSLSALDVFEGDDRRQNETYAMVTLSLPLDTLLGPRTPVERNSLEAPDRETLPIEETPEIARLDEKLALPSEATARVGDIQTPSSSSSSGEVEMSEMAAEQTQLPSEPSGTRAPARSRARGSRASSESSRLLVLVAELSDRVAGSAGTDQYERRLDTLARRARWSGLTPELRLRGVYGFDQTTSLEDVSGLYPGETTTQGGRDSLAEVRLTFHLERLLFSSQEPGLERQKLLARSERRKLQTIAIDLFFEWRAAVEASRDPTLLADEQLPLRIKAESTLAHLHLLTDGWFCGETTMARFGLSGAPELQEEEVSSPRSRTRTRSDAGTNSSNSSK